MNIRTRLHISNIVMIVVPVVIALTVGVLCIVVVWALITGGAPFGATALEQYFGLADFSEPMEHELKVITVLAALVLLVAIVGAVVLTDRFMTCFVFRHITEPLDRLSAGVGQIRGGNLDYRIGYEGADEFAPVCEAFDEMAQRLAGSVERDRRAEEARKELIAGMSHDLRSPLTSIRGYVEGLRDGVAADEGARQRYVGVILDKTADIEHKVSELLAMTKLDMDDYPVDLQPLALDAYVYEFLEREKEELSAQDMEVERHLEAVRAVADRAELDRIVGNLLDNCLRYRAGDHGLVSVRTGEADGRAALVISDDGPGVPEEDLARIFEPLYRGDAARSGSSEGSGLGLSIVVASVARMGGTAEAARSEAGGLSVRILLPLASDAEPSAGEADA